MYSINSANNNDKTSAEIHMLLKYSTADKEASICHITPLIYIGKLWMGNIGSRSNKYCVWKDSKLQSIL